MRIVTFQLRESDVCHVGALIPGSPDPSAGDGCAAPFEVVDLTAALGITSGLDFVKEGASAIKAATKVIETGTYRTKGARLLAPISGMEKVLCVGMNYVDHCTEQNYPIPNEPIIFNKTPSTVSNPGDEIELTPIIKELDWEVELAIVVGRGGRHIPKDKAMDHVYGYTVAHDVSARHWQMKRNGAQWFLGKTFDSFTPIGPCIVTADAFDAHQRPIRCILNGKVMQNSSTKQMIFKTAELISWCSQFMTLKPGDLILTGTPPGVGCFLKPPMFMKGGDVVTVEIEGIGAITNKVVEKAAVYTLQARPIGTVVRFRVDLKSTCGQQRSIVRKGLEMW